MASEEQKMETENSGENVKTLITVNVKTLKDKKAIKIEEKASIKEFKDKISLEFNNTPVEQLCLIFAGKMLKDHETLELHSIKDNLTVHLVIKTRPMSGASGVSTSAESPAAMPKQANANIDQTPFGLGGVGGLPGLANMGMGSANFMELQHQMQETMKNNPAMLQNLIESPLTQNLMSNPEILKSLILSNPQLTRLMDRNPELYDLMGNQDVLRQIMEIAKHPESLQELMGTTAESKSESSNARSSTIEDREFPQSKIEASSTPTGSALYDSAGMHSLMQQMADNPNIMQNMMNAPYTQTMLQNMVDNPDLATSLVGSSPLFAGNSQIQEQMRNMMPAFTQQMNNPAVHNLMSNPDALRSLVQIQGGLRSLHNVSPDLYASLGMPSINPEISSNENSSNATIAESTKDANSSDASNKDKPSTQPPTQDNVKENFEGNNPFSKLMNSMVNRMVEEGLNVPPEERFKEQLATLESLGFVDKEKNIKILTANHGDVNTTIDQLINTKDVEKEQ